jgi:hypothetical protein
MGILPIGLRYSASVRHVAWASNASNPWLAVPRKRRPYSADISKSEAFFHSANFY